MVGRIVDQVHSSNLELNGPRPSRARLFTMKSKHQTAELLAPCELRY